MKTRLLSQHFRGDGLPKKSFDSRAAADEFIAEHSDVAGCVSYRCDVCGVWHFGRPPR